MTDNQVEKIQRLKFIRAELKLKQSDMALKLGINRANLSAIENGRENRSLPNGTIYILEKEYRINPTWFENGEGEMLLPENKSSAKQIGELNYPLEPGETPFIELGEGQYLMVMPLVNEYAYAGYLSGYADPEYVEELSKHTIIVTKQHRGTYRAFEIVGDSMDDGTKDSIPDGSIATGREIQRHLWKSPFHTHRFKDYIIVHETEGILNKRISKHDVDKGIITCNSLNPDKDTYPDFKLHLDEVKQIFNIVNVSIPR